jgi:uncharacterized protein YutE (UPF0331/DUF86 family)
MVVADLVAEKLEELGHRVARVRARCPPAAEGLRTDEDALDLVAFNLMLAVQTCADIAGHLISDEGWRTAVTLAAGFERLAEHGVLTASTAARLANASRFRNVVAHGYAGIDVDKIFGAASDGLADLEAFARQVAAWVAARSASGP